MFELKNDYESYFFNKEDILYFNCYTTSDDDFRCDDGEVYAIKVVLKGSNDDYSFIITYVNEEDWNFYISKLKVELDRK